MAAQLPNPMTPMAFLPPDLAFEVTIASYVLIGTCAVLVWDIADNLTGDYRMLTKHRITPPTIAYFISRLATLTYILGCTLFETAGITNDCHHFDKVVTAFYALAIPSTALLFLFRIRAVFDRNKYVITFFTFMWFAVLAGCIAASQGVTGINIGPTKYCINSALQPYIAAGGIIPVINDTMVFLAISWRLMMNARVEPALGQGVKTFVFGDYLPAFSRALLQDGQVYYLTTVTTNLITVIMFYITALPPNYRVMFIFTNVALMNIMACRVFRNTKFGLVRQTEISSAHTLASTSRGGRDRSANNMIPLRLRDAPMITKEIVTDRESDPGVSLEGHDTKRNWQSGGVMPTNPKASEWV